MWAVAAKGGCTKCVRFIKGTRVFFHVMIEATENRSETEMTIAYKEVSVL